VSQWDGVSKRLAKKYWVWRLYHLLVADAVAIQRPTKYKLVREFLGNSLGVAADIGCGPGVFARYMSSRAKHLIGFDVDCDSLERVKSRHRNLQNVDFAATIVDSLPLPADRLDTVLFLEVLEHLADDGAALREIWRVLRPGGKLVVSVPVPPGEVNENSEWGHKREGYELPAIVHLLAANGFEVEKHAFAEFKFSRRAARVVRWWRQTMRLPAPIFFAWIPYLDHFLDSSKTETGHHTPATVLLVARKRSRE
jgi:SAM-dependent methyltransferase